MHRSLWAEDRRSLAQTVAVDLVVLALIDARLHVLLATRESEPFAGVPELPGGLVRSDENLDEAAARELAEETGLGRLRVHVEQLRSYGEVDRDPRGRVFSVGYLALAPGVPDPAASGAAAHTRWVPVDDAGSLPLAFDHAQILADGLDRVRAKLEYSALATALCPAEFTVAELRGVYEAVWGRPLDPRNFHRKIAGTPGLLIDTGRVRREGAGRPATLYRAGDLTVLSPPLSREA